MSIVYERSRCESEEGGEIRHVTKVSKAEIAFCPGSNQFGFVSSLNIEFKGFAIPETFLLKRR